MTGNKNNIIEAVLKSMEKLEERYKVEIEFNFNIKDMKKRKPSKKKY